MKRLRYAALTPRIAQLALIKWDQGEVPDPFSFQLRKAIVTEMSYKEPKDKDPRLEEAAEAAKSKLSKETRDRISDPRSRLKTSRTRAHVHVLPNGGGKTLIRDGGENAP